MDLKHWLLVVLQCCTISALVVDKPQAIATGSEDLQLPSPATLAHTNTTSLGAEAPQCRADLHGDPGLLSCRQALARMPLQPNREAMSLFTQRPPSKVAQKTSPWRIISPDGLCIIDVVLKTGAKYELANYSDLKDAATRLVRRCVQEERSGGSAAGYGLQGLLTISVSQYIPHVECMDTPMTRMPDANTCGYILQGMPASEALVVFGNRPGPDVQQVLPKRFLDETRKCGLTVLMNGDPERQTWYNIWAAAVSVVGVCLAKGQLGVATINVGSSEFGISFFKNSPRSLELGNVTVVPTLQDGEGVGPANVSTS